MKSKMIAPSADQGVELSVNGVTAGYLANDMVLENVTVTVEPGKVTVLLGPNGSGKSTLLRIMAGFLKPRVGQVTLGGVDISTMGPADRLSQGISVLPQGRSIFPELSVEENLRLGAWQIRHDRQRFAGAVDAMFERYPTIKPMRHKLAGSLSGGQARIVEFARTLILEPRVLLIDEPSVGLAPVLVDGVYDELDRLKEEGRTIMLVDQNVKAAVDLADSVYTLAYGRNHLHGSRDSFEGQLDDLIKQWLNL
ncbi:ABC transporter ATP-binding protein [Cryobacterium psychrophilum]|uniref:ATP-binding cassette domain-containing protein n=1 Tax=Cryobacterium psychrophilum TaxID=41988 RepID=A0A4Y8KS56_9MICO|nr:ATP-binding cassette domain-containing protein [Cryobacterium psychrophilum]TDW29513.1 amino acid/amide ABC transporter ATP-binding protein 2 (HAAT family) [Cryobacterium psychrophilum]TFD81647.1 ATP-binding cassette domain-containing protein [Cryobacterium psychrophilum]